MLTNTQKWLYILSWIPFMIVWFILAVIGAILMVPLALLVWGPNSTDWRGPFILYNNDTENVPNWWYRTANRKFFLIAWFPNYWWYAWRNPVNHSHWWFRDRPANFSGTWAKKTMEAQDLLIANQRDAKRWAFNGMFAGYRHVWLHDDAKISYDDGPEGLFMGHYGERWIGWKVGSDVPGMGFAMQNRPNQEIGT